MYDFSYQQEKKGSKKVEPFSPRPEMSKTSAAMDSKKPNVVNNESAMERAQNMLSKYSNKNFSAPPSNFRDQKIRTFNEDAMSLSSSDAEPSDFEMSASDEEEDSPEKVESVCLVLFVKFLKLHLF